MWIFKRRKEQKIENQEINVKLGETFVLRPGNSASFEIPIPADIIERHIMSGNKLGKIIARYEDEQGNKFETEVEVDIKDLMENKDIIDKTKKRLKSKTKIIYYGPFKKRIPTLVKTIIIIGIVGIIGYIVTGSVIPIIAGMGVYVILEIIIEINCSRINKKYKDMEKIN